VTIESHWILRAIIPGQVAWDNARTAAANGEYGSAVAGTVAMVGEIVLTVVTLGQNTTAQNAARATVTTVEGASARAAGTAAVEIAPLQTQVLQQQMSRQAATVAKSLPVPKVGDPKLGNIVSDLFKGAKGPNPIGTGSTMDALRNEIATGAMTHGRFHTQKAFDNIRALESWLRKNPNAASHDRLVAQSLLDDLYEVTSRLPGPPRL
jgi:hypothetical protein